MSAPNTAEAVPRLAYRAREVAEATGLTTDTVRKLCGRGVIPTLGGCGDVVLIPAWSLHGWAATGTWDHPAWRPVPPTSTGDDDGQAATVTPLRPDAS